MYVEKLAIALRVPVVKLVDGSSGGGSVTTIKKEGWSYLPHVASFPFFIQQLNMGIPNLGAVVGPAVRPFFFVWLSSMLIQMCTDRTRCCEGGIVPFLCYGC